MISFDLDHAHPAYRRSLTRILTDLAEKYPRAPLKRVELFEAKPGDRSLGSTEDGGVIRFSSFWFCRDPAFLQAAAKKCIEVEADSRPVLVPRHYDRRASACCDTRVRSRLITKSTGLV